MKPSEELMLLLELNGYEIRKYRLKKQLEYEDSGNLELYKHKKFADLIVSYYTFEESEDYLRLNPLTYQSYWDKSIVSIDQFIFTHPDFDDEMTFKDFLALEDMNPIKKEKMVYKILGNWAEEYKEASVIRMENLGEMINLLPKRSKKYRLPSIVGLFITILFTLFCILIYANPEYIQSSSLIALADLVGDFNQSLYDTQWFSVLGLITILLLVLYVILNNSFSRYFRDVRSEKSKYAERTFVKWEKDLEKSQLKQSKMLKNYAILVVKDSSKSFLKLKTLIGPELLMSEYKEYVRMVERKFDWMTKHYSKVMFGLKILFIGSLVIFSLFVLIGFAFTRGWIGV